MHKENLTNVEKRYSQTEKEGLALVQVCKRFNLDVFGRKFEPETDHKALEYIYTPKLKPSAMIARWVLCLQSYDYSVAYRPGEGNVADALSRLSQQKPSDRSAEEMDEIVCVTETSTPVTVIAEESEKDEELSSIRTCIQSGD